MRAARRPTAIVQRLSEDDESWFSEDELERSSAIDVNSIAIDGLVRGHDAALWTAHLAHPGVSLRHLPQPLDGDGPLHASGWGLGPAGAALGALAPGDTVAIFGRGGMSLYLAQALALQLADGFALAAVKGLEREPSPTQLITPTMVLCGAGPTTAALSFLARCGVASLAELIGPARAAHDEAVRSCLERYATLQTVMRHVRNDEVLRGHSLLDSLQPRLSAFISDVRGRAAALGHTRRSVVPVVVLTMANNWVGPGEVEYEFVRGFRSMVRHTGGIGILGTTRCGPAHELCDAAFSIQTTNRVERLRLIHHRTHWPGAMEFALDVESAQARVRVRDPEPQS